MKYKESQLERDLERESVNNFNQEGWGLEDVLSYPEHVKSRCACYLSDPIGSEYRRNRWQYTIGLCNQLLRLRISK